MLQHLQWKINNSGVLKNLIDLTVQTTVQSKALLTALLSHMNIFYIRNLNLLKTRDALRNAHLNARHATKLSSVQTRDSKSCM